MAQSREFFANIMKRAMLIYAHKAELEKARSTGDAIATINVVKNIFSGNSENVHFCVRG